MRNLQADVSKVAHFYKISVIHKDSFTTASHKNRETHKSCLLMLCQNPDKPQISSGLWIFDFLVQGRFIGQKSQLWAKPWQ